MKKITFIIALIFLLSACAETARFPVSSVTPAADIVAHKQMDNNGNCKISIIAKNLSSVERLNPPKSNYIVWILTEVDGPRNIGQLKNENAQTTRLETLTPYKFSDIFITAEDQANVTFPTGIEITRTRFR